MTRARMSDEQLAEFENDIAALNSIMRETKAVVSDLDVDTLAYVQSRLAKIMRTAGRLKQRRIAAMDAAREAARAGRENGH